ncbi:MAG: DUF58 domain-containing protein [Treponema sp.]|nr:DUF58 domain-containing protein [Candidatus Treponema caballi]
MIRIPKKVRDLFLFILILFLFTPWKFLQAILMSVLVCILLSYLYSWRLLQNLSVERTLKSVSLAKNESVKITFTVKNNGMLPALACYIQDYTNELLVINGQNRQLLTLRSHELAPISYTLMGTHRGKYMIGPVTIRVADPLMLFPVEMKLDAPCAVTVRPSRIEVPAIPKPGFPQGVLKIQNIAYEDVTMRRSLREYRSGDEQKRINWRASARHTGASAASGLALFTNEYEATFDAPLFVFLNLALDDFPLKQRWEQGEKAIEIAAAVIEKSSMLGQKCGFAAYGTDFPYLAPAKNQAGAILDLLAVIQMAEGSVSTNPYDVYKAKLPSGTRFLVIDSSTVEDYDADFPKGALEGDRV